jgi:glutathione S-transferase
MKLYGHPVSSSTASVLLLSAKARIPLDFVFIDLMKGAHHSDSFTKLNPMRLVPVLEDGDFVLTESSAIMKYLADKVESPLYPREPRQRARINERMDWFNTSFFREFGYSMMYPQLLPHHARATDELTRGTVAWGKEKAAKQLQTLDEAILGPHPYVCGAEMTIADLFGAEMLCLGEVIGCKFGSYPNVSKWIARLKALPEWPKVNEGIDGFRQAMKDKEFVAI